ncbi:MAG: DUF6265 family protein [Henriciella sp.]
MIRFCLSLLILGACASISLAEEADSNRLDWITGCWQSEDGKIQEVWSASEDGYYFGYATTKRDGHIVFFEQMRIDPASMPVFNAYPAGQGPFAFPAVEVSQQSIVFANPEHDFPQKISYARDGATLTAVISKSDGSSPGAFNYLPCPLDLS